MATQRHIRLASKARGCHLVTQELVSQLPNLPQSGIIHIFLQHTSCALTINENADPSVRTDMENIMNKIVPEGEAFYTHTLEGNDDMPAHVKSSLFSTSLQIPITKGQLNLGLWQGIYFCEFRNYGGERNIIATIIE